VTSTNTVTSQIYDIFEGTEQIQQLVIARAASGIRIE
jgi:alkylation response protein AidB-like acyl-CoA dehydrogenase